MRKHKKNCLIGFSIMIIGAVVFLLHALNNPQASFLWSSEISYAIYIAYSIVTFMLLIAGVKKSKIDITLYVVTVDMLRDFC